ncbi:MAG: hypothetical protein WA790_01375 [Sulfitobacter sp.]
MTFRSASPFDARTTMLAVVPEDRRRVDGAAAFQRPLFRSGQTLTKDLLTLDADNAEARLGRLGWFLADGVIDGFRITLKDQDSAKGQFTFGPGSAMGANGQDLSMSRGQTLDLAKLPRRQSDGTPDGDLRGVCVIMLTPVEGYEARPEQMLGDAAGFAWDQQRDASAAPYVDARIVDGFEMSVVRIQSTFGLVEAANGINRAARILIDAREGNHAFADILRRNIAVAMMGVDVDGAIQWVARHGAAERGGGLARRTTHARLGIGKTPRQFRAGVDSLMEQMVNWQSENPGIPFPANKLQTLPAAGIVPAKGGEFPAIFPDTYDHVVAPLPQSEIATVLRRAEALAPYDLDDSRDEVTWHLPVPDALYDPLLLVVPTLPPIFNEAVTFFQGKVAAERARREALRAQVQRVQARIDTDNVIDFGSDDDALDGESGFPLVEAIDVPRYDLKSDDLFDTWGATLTDDLVTAAQRAQLPPDLSGIRRGVVPFQAALVDSLKPANDFVDFGFTRVQADIYRLRQSMLENEESTKLATFPILAGIAKGSNALANSRSLRDYFLASTSARAQLSLNLVDGSPDSTARSFAAGGLNAGPVADFASARAGAASRTDRLFGTDFASSPAGFGVETASPQGFGVAESGGGAGAGLMQSASFGAMAAAASIPLGGGAVVGVTQSSYAGASVVVTGAKATTPGYFSTQFLADAYQEDNVYGKVFEDSRKISTEEYALQTLSDKQAGIKYANALPGSFEDLRTITIADRLASSTALAARTSALRIKADAFSQIQSLAISLVNLRAPVISLDAQIVVVSEAQLTPLKTEIAATQVLLDALDKGITEVKAGGTETLYLIDFKVVFEAVGGTADTSAFSKFLDSAVLEQTPLGIKELAIYTLRGALDPKPSDLSDESVYMASAVSILESVVAAYRATEGRVAAIQGLVENTRILLEALREIEAAWKRDLGVVERDLAEARHDLRVALALRAEEVERVEALALHRRKVIENHVSIAVYARPRRLRPHSAGLTSTHLVPGVYDDPLPAVLRSTAELPPELQKMMQVLADVPVGWFASLKRFKPFLAKPLILDQAFHHAANAASVTLNIQQTQVLTSYVATSAAQSVAARPQAGRRTGLVRTLAQMDRFYGGLQNRMHNDRRQINLAQLKSMTWVEKERTALSRLSLSNLSGTGQNTALTKATVILLEQIESVVGALLATLRQAPAAVRLLWAEKLSGFDGTVRIKDATRLPGWSALSVDMRRDILRYVDWLNRQMSGSISEAQTLMADIIQVAVLVSAFSDVSEIVSARLSTAQDVAGGDIVDVEIDRGSPAIGSRVDFGLGKLEKPIWGRISDLKDGRAKVQVDARFKERISLPRTTSVFFSALAVRQDTRYVR